MGFSEFLNSRRNSIKALISELKQDFDFVSVLGSDVRTKAIRVSKNTSAIGPGRDTEQGFVVKLSNGGVFFEYSLDDISGDMTALAKKISAAFQLRLESETIDPVHLPDEPLVKSFCRESDL